MSRTFDDDITDATRINFAEELIKPKNHLQEIIDKIMSNEVMFPSNILVSRKQFEDYQNLIGSDITKAGPQTPLVRFDGIPLMAIDPNDNYQPVQIDHKGRMITTDTPYKQAFRDACSLLSQVDPGAIKRLQKLHPECFLDDVSKCFEDN